MLNLGKRGILERQIFFFQLYMPSVAILIMVSESEKPLFLFFCFLIATVFHGVFRCLVPFLDRLSESPLAQSLALNNGERRRALME